VYGNPHLAFPWTIEYGDTLGIGLTQHSGVRRVWVTRNGAVQNPPSEEERIKYIDVDKEKSKTKTTVGKQSKEKEKEKDGEEEKRAQENQKAEKWKI
jgi:hypothetical protein